MLVLLDAKPNSGGTKGTTVNHLGFQVPNLRQAIDRVKAAGFPMVTREEITAVPPEAVKDDMAFNPFMETFVAMTMGPEGTKVELVENPALRRRQSRFITCTSSTPRRQRCGTGKSVLLGAIPGSRGKFMTAELPGVSLTVSASPQPVAGTQRTGLDHIGFEVERLEELVRKLSIAGRKTPGVGCSAGDAGIRSALFTDPWGTSLELTEGLHRAVN